MSRFLRLAAVFTVAVALVSACAQNSPTQRKHRRLDAFRSALTSDARAAFDAGNDEAAARLIEDGLAKDPEFRKRLKIVKDAEAISLFEPKDVVKYYRVYFVPGSDGKIKENSRF